MTSAKIQLRNELPASARSNGSQKIFSATARSSSRRRGFTLLELLLAILVFAIVLGAIHVVFFSALKLRDRTSEAIERSLPLQQTLSIIRRDLANIVPPGGVLSGALQSTPTLTTGLETQMRSSLNRGNGPEFYTAVGIVDEFSPWSEIQRISYYLDQPTNDAPGLDLYRSVSRNLLPTTQDETEDQFLMSGVESIQFRYFDGDAWVDTWDSMETDPATGLTNNLPRAIKLELLLHSPQSYGTPAPVELIVPVMVLARTNSVSEISGGGS